jgi:tyrosyl-tRNA synthetase
VCDLLARLKLVSSKNEARRMVTQNAVTMGPDREKISDPNQLVVVTTGLVIRVGKRSVARVRLI